MTDINAADKNADVTVRISRNIWDPAVKLARDFAIAAGVNAISLFAFPPVPGMGEASLSQDFRICAAGAIVTAPAIAVGRYIGGAIGYAVDAAVHNTEGKYRKSVAAVGGAITGATAVMGFRSLMQAVASL